MRELIARGVLALTAVLIVGLSVLFAFRHNRPDPFPQVEASAVGPAPADTAVPESTAATVKSPLTADTSLATALDRGRQVYAEQNCATCHAIAGVGNPRYPLDTIGERHRSADMRSWILGTGQAAGKLSGAVVRRKQRYRALADDDLAALVAYLESLTTPAP